MKHLFSLLFFPVLLILTGCVAGSTNGAEPDIFIVAQWNVQTLFDGYETGREFRDFREAAGWTQEKYQARITALSNAIAQMLRGDPAAQIAPRAAVPALIGFTEIENAGVLEDLARGELARHGFSWVAFANIPGAPIGIGFLSRYPFSDVRSHSITIEGETAPRPLLEVRLEVGGEPLVFLLSHWKSKRGGDIATTPLRRASARVAQRRLGEVKAEEAGTPVIIMGDLNENHNEFYRHLGQVFTALLPDDPQAALVVSQANQARPQSRPDFLVISGEKPPQQSFFGEGVHALYSPWGREKDGGSYHFRGRWETIDHFLLCQALFDGSGWEFAAASVLDFPPFITADGIPNIYIPRTGRGLSDHLPLVLYLRMGSGD